MAKSHSSPRPGEVDCHVTIETAALTSNEKLLRWVEAVADLTQPAAIRWCDGSAEEYDRLAQHLVDAGTFERLNEAKRPNSYLALTTRRRRRADQ